MNHPRESLFVSSSRETSIAARVAIVVLLGVFGATLEKVGLYQPIIAASIAVAMFGLMFVALHTHGHTRANISPAAQESNAGFACETGRESVHGAYSDESGEPNADPPPAAVAAKAAARAAEATIGS
jgi:hypothetical protein